MRESLCFPMHDPQVALADILTALPERKVDTLWGVEPFIEADGEGYFEVASMGDDPVTPLVGTGVRLAYADFEKAAAATPQIIWGTFRGHAGTPDSRLWLIIAAVDSSWWIIETDDLATRRLVRMRFKNVRKGLA